jgi:hypothetical protein
MSAVADNLHVAAPSDEPPPPLVFTDSAAAKVRSWSTRRATPT